MRGSPGGVTCEQPLLSSRGEFACFIRDVTPGWFDSLSPRADGGKAPNGRGCERKALPQCNRSRLCVASGDQFVPDSRAGFEAPGIGLWAGEQEVS
jgi:hypothetical protein